MTEFWQIQFRKPEEKLSDSSLAPFDLSGAFLEELYENGWALKQPRLFSAIISQPYHRDQLIADIHRDVELASERDYWSLAGVLIEGAAASPEFSKGAASALSKGSPESLQKRTLLRRFMRVMNEDISGEIIERGLFPLCARILAYPDEYNIRVSSFYSLMEAACTRAEFFRRSLIASLEKQVYESPSDRLAGPISALRDILSLECCGTEEAKSLKAIIDRFDPSEESIAGIICDALGILALECPLFVREANFNFAPDRLIYNFEEASTELREDIEDTMLDFIEGSSDVEMIRGVVAPVVLKLLTISPEERDLLFPFLSRVVSQYSAAVEPLLSEFEIQFRSCTKEMEMLNLIAGLRSLILSHHLEVLPTNVTIVDTLYEVMSAERWSSNADLVFLNIGLLGALERLQG